MVIETLLGLGNKSLVEAALSFARFIASGKQNRRALRIEGERQAPDPVAGAEAQLFHVGVTRTAQGIGIRTAQMWAVKFEQSGSREDCVLHRFWIIVELTFKRRAPKQYNSKTIGRLEK